MLWVLLAFWLTTGEPSMLAVLQVLGGIGLLVVSSMLAVLQVLGGAGLLVVTYWTALLRRKKP